MFSVRSFPLHTPLFSKIILTISLIIMGANDSKAQVELVISKNQLFIDSLYVRGYRNYETQTKRFFSDNRRAIWLSPEGVIIYEIMVAEGYVNVRFLTKINDDLESRIASHINATKSNWVYNGKEYKVYQALYFSQNYSIRDLLSDNLPGYPDNYLPLPFAPSFEYKFRNSSVQTRREGEYSAFKELIDQRSVRIKFDNYKSLVKRFDKHIKKENLFKAYNVLNEIIWVNPFDINFIEERIRLENKLGRKVYSLYDKPWLEVLNELDFSPSDN